MREDLLGYLLGALEPHEMARVERQLREDPTLQQELELIAEALRPLDESTGARSGDPNRNELPPRDLITKTMVMIPPHDPLGGSLPPAAFDDGLNRRLSDRPLTPIADVPGERGLAARDWFFAASSAAILLAIVLPSVLEGRFEARKIACQDNLRQLGVAMSQFVVRNAESRLPTVEASGHRAFAGVYAPRLREAGLLEGVAAIECPSWEPEQFWRVQGIERPAADAREVTLTMLDQVAARAQESVGPPVGIWIDTLRKWQQTAGGHYAYTLGVLDDSHFSSPRYQGRSSFAVMSDAAMVWHVASAPVQASVRPTASLRILSHDGHGINVLYEDGRVRFLPTSALGRMPDHPLLNHAGRVEAGLTIDDASLAPSWQPPFIDARQR